MTATPLVLLEYRPSEPVALSLEQRDELRRLVPGLTISPSRGHEDRYELTCGSQVGVVRVGDLQVEMLPKVGLAPVMFLFSYAIDPQAWKPVPGDLNAATLAEAVVALFARTVEAAVRPGLLHGYRSHDDTTETIHGRVRFADQLRRRAGLPLPVEVTYDEFTDDILENQMLRAAVDVLSRLRLRDERSRTEVSRLRQHFAHLPDRRLARTAPAPVWTRLNERYRPAVALARLILSGAGLEGRTGPHQASAFVLDMNSVFEAFLRVALQEALHLDARHFPTPDAMPKVWLDASRRVPLKPDLSWWAGGRCRFVGDCKYKRPTGSIPNADVYQMLAYLTALDLEEGLLIYARDDGLPADVTVPAAGKQIRVVDVDISRPPARILAQVTEAARLIQRVAAREAVPA